MQDKRCTVPEQIDAPNPPLIKPEVEVEPAPHIPADDPPKKPLRITLEYGRSQCTARKVRGDDPPMVNETLRLYEGKATSNRYKKVAKALGIPEGDLIAAVESNVTEIPLSGSGQGEFTIRVRGRLGNEDDVICFTFASAGNAIRSVLENGDFTAIAEPMMEHDKALLPEMAYLDIDQDDKSPPADEIQLKAVEDALKRSCAYHWRTQGGGLRFVYLSHDGIRADDTAHAAGALCEIRRAEGKYEFAWMTAPEIKRNSRHPEYKQDGKDCGQVLRGDDDNASVFKTLLAGYEHNAEPTGEEINEWRQENGYMANRHSHTRCPIDPAKGEISSGGEPVSCTSDGIYCHRCNAKGIRYGGFHKAGWRTWASLIHGDSPKKVNVLANAVYHFAPWSHVQQFFPHNRAYESLLRFVHPQEECASSIADTIGGGIPLPLVRGVTDWLNASTWEPFGQGGLNDILETFPGVKIGGKRYTALLKNHTADLTCFGLPPVTILRGADYNAHLRQTRQIDDSRLYHVTPADPPCEIRRDVSNRELAAALRFVSEHFPRMPLKAVLFQVALKGIMQRGKFTDIPILWFVGQSGAGKTITARIAAQIASDDMEWKEFRSHADQMRNMQAYADHCDTGRAYAVNNEFGKDTVANAAKASEMILAFQKGVRYHKMYHGSETIARPAALILTGTHIPAALKQEVQVARRIVIVPFPATGEIDWRGTCGTADIDAWRKTCPGAAKASDVILSWVIKRYFSDAGIDHFQIAKSLRLNTLLEYAGPLTGENNDLLDFYREVQAMSECTTGRRRHNGWRMIRTDIETEASRMYMNLSQNGKSMEFVGQQWAKITGKPEMICTLYVHGKEVYINFHAGKLPRGVNARKTAA
jgi:hypothetical protein